MKSLRALAITLAVAPALHAQQPSDLLKELSAANEKAITTWRSQDRAGFAATFAPGALYVSNDGIFAVKDILDGLMTCKVGEVTVSQPQAHSVTADTAVLVSKQHQQVTCSGHQEPADIHSTQTFVKIDGQWRVALRTDTPTHR